MAKAQLSIEFTMMLAIALLLCMMYLAVGSELFASTGDRQRIAALNEIGYTIQDELILATTVEDGYRRVLTLPQRADRFTYEITTYATAVQLNSSRVVLTFSIPEISGSFAKGANLIVKDDTLTVSQ